MEDTHWYLYVMGITVSIQYIRLNVNVNTSLTDFGIHAAFCHPGSVVDDHERGCNRNNAPFLTTNFFQEHFYRGQCINKYPQFH